MKGIGIVTFLLALAAVPAVYAAGCDKADCDDIKAEIREIQARMRAGYTRAQGEKYEAKLRKLKRERRRVCR